MKKKLFALAVLFTMACMQSVLAAASYTNTWQNAQGVSVWKNWGDAANWKVTYGASTSAPESAVPTKDSLSFLKTSASVALESGDDYALGETYFLAAGTRDKTLNVKIPLGARLALVGTGLESWMGTSSWVNGGVHNFTTFDIDGGSLILSQNVFNMRGNQAAAFENAPVNHIIVHNGGTLAITNGSLRMYGGSAGDSQGRGVYTNVIDVLAGSTLCISNAGRMVFGSAGKLDAPWSSSPYYGAGWLNVKGGRIAVDKALTHLDPIVMGCFNTAGEGAYLNVSDGGVVDLGGKDMFVYGYGKSYVTVTGGSVITNGALSFQNGPPSYCAGYYNLIDVSHGLVYAGDFKFSTRVGNANPRCTVRIHGDDSKFSFDEWSIDSSYMKASKPPVFFDMRLRAHTLRTSDFAISPITTRKPAYNNARNASLVGYYRISPDGGFQLLHKSWVEMQARWHDGDGDYGVKYKLWELYGGLIGEDMWATNCTWFSANRWESYVGYQYAYVFRAKLKDSAMLADGVTLSEGRPRAWMQLPKFTARQLNTNRTERVSVRLFLEAPAEGTLDLAGVVKTLRTQGDQNACVDDSLPPYNVRIDLPMDELKANTTDDKVVMDFVTCDNYWQAAGDEPMVTNALIRAATCEVVDRRYGFRFIVR